MRPFLLRLKEFRRRFKSTRPFRLTGAGWVFILYTIGVGAGAINTGNNLLYLAFGVFLGLIIASGALSDMSLWSLQADCVWPRAADAGDPVMVPVRVTNRKRFLPSICVTLDITGEVGGETLTGRAYLGYLPAGATETTHAILRPTRRGWFQARSVRFTTRYPFGLLNKRWISSETPAFDGAVDRTSGFFVFPRGLALDRRQVPSAAAGLHDAGAHARRGEGDSIFGLREFRDDDSPRRIDWKASAKRAGAFHAARAWVVRETERDRESEVALSWDAGALAAMTPDARETALRFGRALIDAYAALGHRARFYVTDGSGRRRVAAPSGWDGEPEQEFLALWTPGAGPGLERYLLPARRADDLGPSIDVLAAFAALTGRAA